MEQSPDWICNYNLCLEGKKLSIILAKCLCACQTSGTTCPWVSELGSLSMADTVHARAGSKRRVLPWLGPSDTTCRITLNSLTSAPQYRACTLTRVSGKDATAENWKISRFIPSKVRWKSHQSTGRATWVVRTRHLKSCVCVWGTMKKASVDGAQRAREKVTWRWDWREKQVLWFLGERSPREVVTDLGMEPLCSHRVNRGWWLFRGGLPGFFVLFCFFAVPHSLWNLKHMGS